jgi:hypothetical protein
MRFLEGLQAGGRGFDPRSAHPCSPAFRFGHGMESRSSCHVHAAGRVAVSSVQQAKRQPERATNCPRDITDPQALEVRLRPRLVALLAPPDEVGSHRKPLPVVQPESVLGMGRGEETKRVAPRLALERHPALIYYSGHRASLAQ